MKSRLGLEMRPADTLEMQLLCNCCGQPHYPDKAWADRIRAIVFGAEQYAVCPLCTQAVPEQMLADEEYRQRCRDTAAKCENCSKLQGEVRGERPQQNRATRNANEDRAASESATWWLAIQSQREGRC